MGPPAPGRRIPGGKGMPGAPLGMAGPPLGMAGPPLGIAPAELRWNRGSSGRGTPGLSLSGHMTIVICQSGSTTFSQT